MKIKNFKISQKAKTKLLSYVLVGTIACSLLTGCADRDSILDGTRLENTCVVTFADGSKDIVVAVGTCDKSLYHHYYSITSGEYFSDKTCIRPAIEGKTAHHYEIVNEENITSYLTADELKKAMNGELSDNDIIEIVSRTVTSNEEKVNTKVK